MGLVRLLLALSVVFSHLWRDGTGPFPGGFLAVQAFFIISGFYMSLILQSDVYAGKPAKFWISRLLRIFPSYWLLALASALLTYLIAPETYAALRSQGIATVLLAIVANVFIVGQDVQLWLVNVGGSLSWTADSWSYPPPRLSNFVLITPAWSLALELAFYALAPFVVRCRTSTLVGCIAVSLVARFAAFASGLAYFPWTTCFFPFELAFFLLGVVAHRMMRARESRVHGVLALALLVGTIATFQYLPRLPFWIETNPAQAWNDWLLLALVFASLPSVFRLTQHSKLDAVLGELSYPLYLSHMVVAAGISGFGFGDSFWMIVAVTFVLSAVLAFGVDRPMSKFRHGLEPMNRPALLRVST